jgi:hypothetical protein
MSCLNPLFPTHLPSGIILRGCALLVLEHACLPASPNQDQCPKAVPLHLELEL